MDLQGLVTAVVRARDARIEAACEAALQGGTCGVIIEGDRAWPDSRVPYGHIIDASACGADNVDWETVR